MTNQDNGQPDNDRNDDGGFQREDERGFDREDEGRSPASEAAVEGRGSMPDMNGLRHGHRGRGHRHGEHDEHGGRGRHGGHGHGRGGHYQGAQTFRRGRAVAFLEELRVKRDVLRAQLNDPDMGIIKEIVSGELKAVDEIIKRFMHTFELHETVE
ncbi:hypothetical protein GXP70_01750 [Paenibacillus lycopersici]|uniref:Uncharacterized protein n=1 Tax=Paenibacillus lycopersici TaxID=2704462 RepID=A0A6C0FV60_9BACL|nr:hypothetical protein [Paenibacillus lycopersici]QHT58829.1 hypothetical protein GXP70_01750 [Paenibacillus lycopersici]